MIVALSARMPELASLEILLAVARTGSLSAAAREVGLTQQAVSARMAALETQTSVRLATRTTRGAELTAAGTVVVQWADRLLHVAHEVDAGLASLRDDSRSRIRVSASLTIAEQLLPSWLVSLQADAVRRGETPVQVVLTATNSDHVIEQVRGGAADLGFVEGPGAPRGLRSRVVAHDELVVVVPPEHRWTRRPSAVSAAELRDTPLVTRELGSGTREFLTAALRRTLGDTIEPASPALELSTAASVRAAVLAGAAPAVLSRLAVADDLRAGRLRRIVVAGLDLRRDLRAVWMGAGTPPAGAVRILLSHIGALTHDE
jgi:DNA-binding transcriptional LysR family regulator